MRWGGSWASEVLKLLIPCGTLLLVILFKNGYPIVLYNFSLYKKLLASINFCTMVLFIIVLYYFSLYKKLATYETKYSRMAQVKFVEDSL